MKKPSIHKTAVLALAISGFALLAPDLRADDIPLSHVPPQVAQAILDRYPTARFVKAEREEENGRIRYEIEISVNGKEVDVEVSAAGRILEVND